MIDLRQVPRLVFGSDAMQCASAHLQSLGVQRPFILTTPVHRELAQQLHAQAIIDCSISAEPTVAQFESLLSAARAAGADAVAGLGGGSVLDTAKLVAALLDSKQTVQQCFGSGNLQPRTTPLLCIPTTAGTGSEVSPNAILLDEETASKKAVISPWLVPDAAFVDPALTITVPAHVTAATGLDALTHCIEAYANNFAHPLVDTWALDGIRHIAAHLATAVHEPRNLEARTHVALGSLYGGLCLGPVNTAAVHALSYPLGSRFHIPHGHANAILLPHVLRFNIPAAPERYTAIALAMGARSTEDAVSTAQAGLCRLWELIDKTGLEMRLSALRISRAELPTLAAEGLAVTRLMRNNPRPMTQQDAEAIYQAAFDATREQ
jgi:alcohol dehydrogenase class IV